MPSSTVCWGIEVGAGAVKALKLELGSDGPRVADYAVIPHARVLSEPDVDASDAKRVALGRLVNEYDLSGATIAVSVPGHSAFARFAKLPPVEQKKVPQIVKFEAVQQIPFPLEDVEWDYQTFRDPESPDVEVGIFAVTKERIKNDLDLLAEVGLTPDVVTLSPVAAYNAIAFDLEFTEKTPGTILLDVGTTATDLIIADSGRVWIRTFPLGGHEFTQALVEAFKLSYPKAEKLKREAETSKHARHVFQALRPVFSDLAQDVQRSIGYYQSLHRDADLSRLIGMGSTFQIPGMRKYLKQQLGINVYRMERFKRVGFEGPQAAEFEAHAPNLTTVLGLALQGLGQATLEANVVPVTVVRNAMWSRKTKWFITAAGLGLAASGALFIRPFLDQTRLDSVVPPTEIDEASRLASRLTREATEARVTEAVANNFDAANVIDLFADRRVYGWLLNDASSMVQTGQQHQFQLLSMQTQYLFDAAGGAAPEGFEAPADEPSLRGGRRGQADTRDPRSRPSPAGRGGGDDFGDGAPAQGEPRVAVELTIQTSASRENIDEIVAASIGRWMASNNNRADAPYTIRVEPDELWRPVLTDASGQAEPTQTAPARTTGRVTQPGRRGVPDDPRGRSLEQEIEERLREDMRTPGFIGGSGATPTPPGEGPSSAASVASLDQLAPITQPEQPAAGTTIVVRFEAVLRKSATNGGGA